MTFSSELGCVARRRQAGALRLVCNLVPSFFAYQDRSNTGRRSAGLGRSS